MHGIWPINHNWVWIFHLGRCDDQPVVGGVVRMGSRVGVFVEMDTIETTVKMWYFFETIFFVKTLIQLLEELREI